LADLCNNDIGLDIFSLNYDLCIETALEEIQRDFVNGFTSNGWSPTALAKNDPIRFFKLHGSLDWVDDKEYGLCSLRFPRHKDAVDIEIEAHKPLLIFGTNHKLSACEPFLSLIYYFAQCILITPVLAVIGYSFGDKYINDIIMQGVRTNARLKIIIISPDAEQRIGQIPLLNQNPRVHPISGKDGKAKEVLNNLVLLSKVKELLRESSNEEPFK